MSNSYDDIHLPLFDLFMAVKKLDKSTGHGTVDTQSWLLLLETVRRGFMVNSKEELLFLCEKLWLKPYHIPGSALDQEKLKELFDHYLAAFRLEVDKTGQPLPVLDDPAPIVPSTPEPRRDKKRETPSRTDPGGEAVPSSSDSQIIQQTGEWSVSLTKGDSGSAEVGAMAAFPETAAKSLPGGKFLLKGNYLPIQPRRIEQSMRSYRHKKKGSGKWQLDWPGTIEAIAKKGYFSGFVFREKDIFNTDWTVLIDQSPSMAAFGPFSDEIAAAVARGNSTGYDAIFYFGNFPETLLYEDRLQTTAVNFARWAGQRKKNILIVSDAGAARGLLKTDRVKASLRALKRLAPHRVAWLNPMPRIRWRDTSAEIIGQYTDMFDIGEGSMDSLNNIVRLFKSKISTGKL